MAIKTFERIETKYVVSEEQYSKLIKILEEHMKYDAYCQNGNTYLVQNIYFDTINNTLISHSISKPNHKIKIRIRHYVGSPSYYLEWKQKTGQVVSKRRISLNQEEYETFISKGELPQKENYLDLQIEKEFSYFQSKYYLLPTLYLSYQRIALFSNEDNELRITFDREIRGSRTNFNWNQEKPETQILKDGYYVLEIKYNANYPLWLARALSSLKIFHQSFSKYGEEYKNYLRNKEEIIHECI